MQSYFIARNRKPRSAEIVDLHGALEREEGMEGERERERRVETGGLQFMDLKILSALHVKRNSVFVSRF